MTFCIVGECIGLSSVCDGFPDCPGKEDEEDCAGKKGECPAGRLRCPNSRVCIPKGSMCDGKVDCPLGTDEKSCVVEEERSKCNAGEFVCDVDACKPRYLLCNGKADCWDGSDENSTMCGAKGFVRFYQVSEL
jgi:hypothetical protein